MKEELLKASIGFTHTVSIENEDVDFSAKLEILPTDRIDGDYKITIAVRRAHGDDATTDQAILAVIKEARKKAVTALDDYFSKSGRQLSLSFSARENTGDDNPPKASRNPATKKAAKMLTDAALTEN